MQDLQKSAEVYRTTGGIHASALSDGERLLVVAEDVGRMHLPPYTHLGSDHPHHGAHLLGDGEQSGRNGDTRPHLADIPHRPGGEASGFLGHHTGWLRSGEENEPLYPPGTNHLDGVEALTGGQLRVILVSEQMS